MCGIMGDPELRSDESVLLRTQGIFVKSIPFEGILTNKRIILVDRVTNILPQKEIPLVTIKDFQAGENAIRDQIITLSVLAKTGETRQMILTFSRQAGGNRIKERDDWMKVLRGSTSSSFEQVIRKIMPGARQSPKKSTLVTPPRIEIISSPVSQNVPAAEKTSVKKKGEDSAPVKRIIKTSPDSFFSSSASKTTDVLPSGSGPYCTRCGNRVPDESKFCNRCGFRIVVPGNPGDSTTPKAAAVLQPPIIEPAERTIQPKNKVISAKELSPTQASTLSATSGAVLQQSEKNTSPATPMESTSSLPDSDEHDADEKSEAAPLVINDSRNSEPIAPSGKPPFPRKSWDVPYFKPGKKVVLGIIVVIIIVAVVLGAFFIYPMITGSEGVPDIGAALMPVPTDVQNSETTVMPTATVHPAPGNSGSTVGF
jgi:DNA-directed RNA polymerase subunit RPC12/RpoP